MKKDVTREGVVVVIDDDDSVRAVLKELLESVGLKVRLYASANAFQEDRIPDATSCLVLDVRLHETSGLKVQEELKRAEVQMPIVLITAYGDIPMPVRAVGGAASSSPSTRSSSRQSVSPATTISRGTSIPNQTHQPPC